MPPNLPTAPRRVTTAQNNRMLRARFDSQYSSDENRNHWAMADAMSVDASASWMVRRVLRMRNRYEFHNNSYYMGIARTIADYVIGTGPRLQMLTQDKELNVFIEGLWNDWAEEIRLAETLWLMRHARIYNGESVSVLRNNPGLDNPIKLDVFQVECDQLASPMFGMYPSQYPDQYFDGVVLDPWGRPMTYHLLRQHPGAFGAFVILGYEFDAWPARYVLHDFKKIRPGQQRGIPEMTPALELFAKLRRYTGAVVGAAETAADYAVLLESDEPAESDPDADQFGALDTVEFRSRMGTVLPHGYKASQMRAEQPTTVYDNFVWSLLREICRCTCLPVSMAGLDSSKSNMSAEYVTSQPFAKSVEVDRSGYNVMLNRTFDEFMNEAIRIEALLPKDIPQSLPHQWMWPSLGQHADPNKIAKAAETELSSGTTNIPREYAKKGLDWEAEQQNAAKSLGITIEEYRQRLADKMFAVPKMEAQNPPVEEVDTDDVPVQPNGDNDQGDED